MVSGAAERPLMERQAHNSMAAHPPLPRPDMAPCDFRLLPKVKMPEKGRCFGSIRDTEVARTEQLQTLIPTAMSLSCLLFSQAYFYALKTPN